MTVPREDLFPPGQKTPRKGLQYGPDVRSLGLVVQEPGKPFEAMKNLLRPG